MKKYLLAILILFTVMVPIPYGIGLLIKKQHLNIVRAIEQFGDTNAVYIASFKYKNGYAKSRAEIIFDIRGQQLKLVQHIAHGPIIYNATKLSLGLAQSNLEISTDTFNYTGGYKINLLGVLSADLTNLLQTLAHPKYQNLAQGFIDYNIFSSKLSSQVIITKPVIGLNSNNGISVDSINLSVKECNVKAFACDTKVEIEGLSTPEYKVDKLNFFLKSIANRTVSQELEINLKNFIKADYAIDELKGKLNVYNLNKKSLKSLVELIDESQNLEATQDVRVNLLQLLVDIIKYGVNLDMEFSVNSPSYGLIAINSESWLKIANFTVSQFSQEGLAILTKYLASNNRLILNSQSLLEVFNYIWELQTPDIQEKYSSKEDYLQHKLSTLIESKIILEQENNYIIDIVTTFGSNDLLLNSVDFNSKTKQIESILLD